MSKRFWLIIVALAVIFFGFLLFSGGDDNSKNGSSDQASNHVKNNTNSKVKLVEYGDFQCPVCGTYYPVVEQITEKYKDNISFQFRHLPLTQIHQNAFAAARAAEAASKQDKFWEMYGLLYQNQTAWSESTNVQAVFNGYAKQLGMNESQFKTDFASSAANKTINNDVAAFKKTGETMATPAFFLNGKKIPLQELVDSNNSPDINKFSKLIDEALKKAGQTPPSDDSLTGKINQ